VPESLFCRLSRDPSMASSPPAPSFSLITSLRYDTLLLTRPWNSWPGNPPSSFFLLPYHFERLVGGARDFEWAVALESLGVGWKGDKDLKRHGDQVTGEQKYEYAPALERFRALCSECVDQYFAEHPGSDVDQPLKVGFCFKRQPFPLPCSPATILTACRSC
jgi:hypothetical protein